MAILIDENNDPRFKEDCHKLNIPFPGYTSIFYSLWLAALTHGKNDTNILNTQQTQDNNV
ncbi:MAG: hypothetical protein ACD_33C00036G0009 [uncultured bacterium]|nr:MAG: hypothetical protein ACD_33C00036G0009 [uncultured bacterium]